MKLLPESLNILVAELGKLPGVGERTAMRYAVSLLRAGSRRLEDVQRALKGAAENVSHCPTCHFWTQAGFCPVCEDAQRPATRLCVVRDSPDVVALERFRAHPWKYHVLQGLLSPLGGVGPQQLRLESLFNRIRDTGVQEIILALDATVEGDATSLYIRDHMRDEAPGVKLTRTALGLPAGSSVEYLDPSTLENALTHRTEFD
jgi:recombination protein RecR